MFGKEPTEPRSKGTNILYLLLSNVDAVNQISGGSPNSNSDKNRYSLHAEITGIVADVE